MSNLVLTGAASTGNSPSTPLKWNDDFHAAQASGVDMQQSHIAQMFARALNERIKAVNEIGAGNPAFWGSAGLALGFSTAGQLALFPDPAIGDDTQIPLRDFFQAVYLLQWSFVPRNGSLGINDSMTFDGRIGAWSQPISNVNIDPSGLEGGFPFYGSTGTAVTPVTSIGYGAPYGSQLLVRNWDRLYPYEIVMDLSGNGPQLPIGPRDGATARVIVDWQNPANAFNPVYPSGTKIKWDAQHNQWVGQPWQTTPDMKKGTFDADTSLPLDQIFGRPPAGDYVTGTLLNQLRDAINKLVWTCAYVMGFPMNSGSPLVAPPCLYFKDIEYELGTYDAIVGIDGSDYPSLFNAALNGALDNFNSFSNTTPPNNFNESVNVSIPGYTQCNGFGTSTPAPFSVWWSLDPSIAAQWDGRQVGMTISESSAGIAWKSLAPNGITRAIDFYIYGVPAFIVVNSDGTFDYSSRWNTENFGGNFKPQRWQYYNTVFATPTVALNPFIDGGGTLAGGLTMPNIGAYNVGASGVWGVILRYDLGEGNGGFVYTKDATSV